MGGGGGGGGSERVPSVLRYYGTPKFLLRINIRAFIAQFTLYHSQITKSKNKIIQIIKYYINIYLLFHQNVEIDVL